MTMASMLVCGAGAIVLLVAVIVSIGLYESEVDEMIAALDRAAEEKHDDNR